MATRKTNSPARKKALPTADELLGALATHEARILPTPKARALAGNLSPATWTRIEARGEGPPKVWLSPRRKGYPLGPFKEWLASRGVPAGDANGDEEALTVRAEEIRKVAGAAA